MSDPTEHPDPHPRPRRWVRRMPGAIICASLISVLVAIAWGAVTYGYLPTVAMWLLAVVVPAVVSAALYRGDWVTRIIVMVSAVVLTALLEFVVLLVVVGVLWTNIG